ncbi:MAG: D-alanyl-D-alanine carboxypeptidase [alpha proteobacterium HIMB59]|nr:MAG: D-alanyl-D-alanine carboxypeptidase [alpha proteobacterium HIMB59]
MDTLMPKYTLKPILFLLFFFLSKPLFAIDSIAETALVMDISTGEILLEKNSNMRTFPSSMTKIMTVLVAFEKIKNGSLSLDQEFLVSKKAWKMGGSKMFIEVDKRVKVFDLLLGIVVQSGNDASIALAEGISGTEETFAIEMNNLAKKIGLADTNFVNSSGWPNDSHYTTAKDLALLAKYTVEKHPELYQMYELNEFTYNGIKQDNRNPLLLTFDGADGFKTGYTEAAGYGIVGSAERGGRRLIIVMNGLESSRSRAQESLRLMDWGFNNFELVNFFKKNEIVFQANTWLGKKEKVDLVAIEDIKVSIPKAQLSSANVDVLIEEPIQTPINKGDIIANLQISYADKKVSFPLAAGENIEQKGFFSRITSALYYIVLGSN